MADIDVGRRRPSPWAWVAGLLVLVLVIWAITRLLGPRGDPERVEAMERGEFPDAPATVGPQAPAAPGVPAQPLDAGEVYADVVREAMVACTGRPAVGPAMVRECTGRFDRALSELLRRPGVAAPGGDDALRAFRERVALMETVPDAAREEPGLARDALLALVEVFAAMQRSRAVPEAEAPIRQLRDAAERVDPGLPLERQQEALGRYFDMASGLLGMIDGATPASV